jgi:hypothetical protein
MPILYETTPGVRIEHPGYVIDLGHATRNLVGLYVETNEGESLAQDGIGESLKVKIPVVHAIALRDGLTRWLESVGANPCPTCGREG